MKSFPSFWCLPTYVLVHHCSTDFALRIYILIMLIFYIFVLLFYVGFSMDVHHNSVDDIEFGIILLWVICFVASDMPHTSLCRYIYIHTHTHTHTNKQTKLCLIKCILLRVTYPTFVIYFVYNKLFYSNKIYPALYFNFNPCFYFFSKLIRIKCHIIQCAIRYS